MLGPAPVDFLEQALRAAGIGDVRVDTTSRAAYSSDASLYRVTPTAVVLPRHADEVAAAAGTISYELFCSLARRVPVIEI